MCSTKVRKGTKGVDLLDAVMARHNIVLNKKSKNFTIFYHFIYMTGQLLDSVEKNINTKEKYRK